MSKLFVRVYGKVKSGDPLKTPIPPGRMVNVTSRAADEWSRSLSPMFAGPVATYGGKSALTVEAGWQFAKVIAEQYIEKTNTYIPTGHLGEDGLPTAAWFEWRDSGWQDARLIPRHPDFAKHKMFLRKPFGKKPRVAFNYWEGEKLGYIESRAKVYVPLYERAVQHTDAFKRLCDLAVKEPIKLFDVDGYDHVALNMNWDQCLNYADHPYGHGLVLAKLIERTVGIPLAKIEDY